MTRPGAFTAAVCLTLCGHSETTVPKTITGPATHIHQMRGLINILKATLPFSRFSLGTTNKSSTGVDLMAALVDAMLNDG